MNLSFLGTRRALLLVAMVLVSAIGLPSPVAAEATPQTEAEQVLAIAQSLIGDKYAFAATGPKSFDCSGFVFYVYKQAGLLDRIGGKRRTVAGYHNWFLKDGQVSKSFADALPGDLLVWGSNHHTGIYVGNNIAISALINPYGVKLHRVDRISLQLTAVLHVQLTR